MEKLGYKTVADLQKLDVRTFVEEADMLTLRVWAEREGNYLPMKNRIIQIVLGNPARLASSFLKEWAFYEKDILGSGRSGHGAGRDRYFLRRLSESGRGEQYRRAHGVAV